jgi:citrate lyase subunit beta/citryl-CoA lyase
MAPPVNADGRYRSLLMVPGHKPEFAIKAAESDAEAVWLDLEDGVPEEHKVAARQTVVESVRGNSWGQRTPLVRINPMSTRLAGDDVKAAVAARASGICMTKIMAVEEVSDLDRELTKLETAEGLAPMVLWLMLETPISMFRIEQVATASPRVQALLYGGGGLLAELQPEPRKLDLLPQLEGFRYDHIYGRSQTVLAARALGKLAIDSSFGGLRDDAAYRDTLFTFQLGFDGRMISSPRHVDLIHRAWDDGLGSHDGFHRPIPKEAVGGAS